MYPFRKVEEKWQERWSKKTLNNKKSKKPFYVLEMFPYPSGELHMGHVRNYALGDAIARFHTHLGYDVLHPMGWDAFGLPAENAAKENGVHPEKWTYENIKKMRGVFKTLGFDLDWGKEMATCHPGYYGMGQKLFIELFNKGLIFQKESVINWDPVEESVLANEQVIDGCGWRSGVPVERKKLTQWFLKITEYADELLEGLSELNGWPEKVSKMQENWIGKSKGCNIKFKCSENNYSIDVYTTRPETIFGASFIGISPSHQIAEDLSKKNKQIEIFIDECKKVPTSESAISTQEKKGIFTGLYAYHPFEKSLKIPVYIANFVLMEYGTGAVFACPAHDDRDLDFAKKYDIPVKTVIDKDDILFNSDFLNGMSIKEGREAVIKKLEEIGSGKEKEQYRIRDWCISRQRYWGCPIPIIHCGSCGPVPVPDDNLPLKLPEDISFEKGGNPIEHHETWKKTTCPKCGIDAVRETDTLDTFFESSWYFMRFPSPRYENPIDTETVNYYGPVNWYIGGIEHAVMHLLYARFFTKAFRDLGHVNYSEPFKNLLTQGMVNHPSYKDKITKQWLFPHEVARDENGIYKSKSGNDVEIGRGVKMSKSKKNVVTPKEIIENYGADAARLFILSDTPPDKDFEWSTESLEGAWRYLNRLWRLSESIKSYNSQGDENLISTLHKYNEKIKKAYEENGFNRVIAFTREITNILDESIKNRSSSKKSVNELFNFLILSLHPLIPHICEEIFEIHNKSINLQFVKWPEIDKKLLIDEKIIMAVQINGKLRGKMEVKATESKENIEKMAIGLSSVKKFIENKEIKKTIVVPKRIVNIVVG